MTPCSERSQPATEATIVVATLVAIALFVVTWALLHVGFYAHDQVLDTPVYQRYGNAIARGEVPYRDFAVEYPPGALPVFALPGLAEPGEAQHVASGFRRAFEVLMWVCGALALTAMAIVLRSVGAGATRVWAALCFAAAAPLFLGSVVLSRFDLWPTAAVVAAVAALAAGSWRLGSGLLGVGIAIKLFPGVLVPLAVAHVWRHEGRRAAAVSAGIAAVIAAAVFVPFVALSPSGLWESVSGQLTRPLQLESLGASLLLAAHQVFGAGVTVESSHGSQNLAGAGADGVATALTVVQAAALIGLWAWFARRRRGAEELVAVSAAALVLFVALGKVLSPQFLIWLIPVVPLVGRRRGVWASALLALALVLTQLWFPFRYWDLATDLDPTASWLVLARDLVLVALAVVLVLPRRVSASDVPAPGTAPSPVTEV